MFSVGMYVSCPIHKNGNTIYVLGRIKKNREETDQSVVVFFDKENKNRVMGILPERQMTYFSYELIRGEIKAPASALWKSKSVNILCELSCTKNTFKYYCIQYRSDNKSYVTKVPESELEIDFYLIKTTAIQEASQFINCDTKLYSARQYLSKRKRYIDSLEDIISTLVNTRINLYPHQIDSVIKATREGTTRIMLADEVGLGKTIEALTILKFHIQKNKRFRCLIVTPSSLEFQWSNETNERFGIKAESFSYNKIVYHKTNASVFIISYADFKRYMYELDDMHWDMLIIDEAHKILKTPYFSVLKRASGKIKNVILLSATPITHDGEEYLQLMKMLNPVRFGKMSIEQYRELDHLQGIVRDKLFDMNTDLELFNQIEMTDSFVMNLEELNEDLKDRYLGEIINAISPSSNDKGLYAVNLALEYIRKQYVIESNLIRHRKKEIEEAAIERKLRAVVTYDMEGAAVGVYESNVYDALLTLISENINSQNKYQWIRLLEALHSSPYALLNEFYRMEAPGSEKRKCFELIGKWEAYCDKEIESLKKGEKGGNTRFGKLVEAVNECTDSKILIFSEFRETAKKIYSVIQAIYGNNSAALFDSSMSRLEAQLAARKFQNDDTCRFIICDRSGGEGRNFQKADIVIHFDMSWSPAMMEQRIGRLDRIGRDLERPVDSIVIYAADTIEENIFNLYNNSLKVFARSLCGLEIIFEELQEMIAESFARDIQFGLSHAQKEIENLVSQMEESVEREIYFSTSNETSAKEQTYIKEVSEAFERECENEAETKIITLLKHAGVEAFIEPASGIVYADFEYADRNKLRESLLYEAYELGEYEGTFRREYAVKHDSIDYFSTEHVMYQIAMNLVDKVQKGRFHAVSAVKDTLRWAGFVFVWNVDFNYERLFKGGLNPQKYRFIKKYLNEQQITNVHRIYGNFELNENEICTIFENEKKRLIKGITDTVGYGMLYDDDSWDTYLGECLKLAKISAKERARSWLKSAELADYLSRTRIAEDLEKHTVCEYEKKRIEAENTILAALNDCELQIDSILYIEL